MKKVVLGLALVAGLTISLFGLTGCKNPILKKTEETKNELESINEVVGETTNETNQNEMLNGEDNTISINATSEFENGLAVLKGDEKSYIVDENFNILWSYNEKYGDKYVDGYVELNDVPTEGTTTIYDKNGNEKFSYTTYEYENVELASNGCLIITKKTDTYNSSSTTEGIYSLEKQKYILQPKEEYVGNINDRRDGMFEISGKYFNSKTEKTITYKTSFLTGFNNGYAVIAETDGIKVFTEDGKEYSIKEPNREVTGVREHSDNMVYDIYNNNIFNLKTKKVISLQNQFAKTSSDYCPVFENGYALVKFTNQGNTPYYTVIDSTGKMMFEPVRLEDQNGSYKKLVSKKLNSGYFIVEVDGVDVVYDKNNNEIIRASSDEEFEGITNSSIMVLSQGKKYYKDMQGNIINFKQQ